MNKANIKDNGRLTIDNMGIGLKAFTFVGSPSVDISPTFLHRQKTKHWLCKSQRQNHKDSAIPLNFDGDDDEAEEDQCVR